MVSSITKTTKTTANKTAKTTAKTTATAKAADMTADGDIDASASPDAAPELSLGKRELIDRVVAASGIKKKAAKPVVEAILKELGDAISRGETLNLQPFGKANVKRHKDLEHAEIIEVRLRRSKLAIKAAQVAAEGKEPADPLAEAAE